MGKHLRRALLARGCEVIGVDRPGTAAELAVDLGSEAFTGRAADELAERAGALDGVIYMAATITRGSSVDAAARSNLRAIADAAVDVFEACHARSPNAHYVYCSTYKTYGPGEPGPIDPQRPPQRPDPHSYGCAKSLAERLLAISAQRLGVGYAVVRPTCIYGPGQHTHNAIPTFLRSLLEGRAPVVFGTGRDIRDDVFAPDLAYAMIEACLRRVTGAFHAGGERSRNILDTAEVCCDAVAKLTGNPRLSPVLDPSRPPKWWLDQVFDAQRTRTQLDYVPTPLLDGLIAEARWLQAGALPSASLEFCPPPRLGAR